MSFIAAVRLPSSHFTGWWPNNTRTATRHARAPRDWRQRGVASMSATGEPSAKRAKHVDAAAERAHLLTTLLQYQASRKPADDAVGEAEAACEAQLRESLTAAVLQLPPSSVVSKSALAAFKEQHAAMCRVNAAAKLTTKMDPTSAEAPDVKPPAQTDAPVKSEQ